MTQADQSGPVGGGPQAGCTLSDPASAHGSDALADCTWKQNDKQLSKAARPSSRHTDSLSEGAEERKHQRAEERPLRGGGLHYGDVVGPSPEDVFQGCIFPAPNPMRCNAAVENCSNGTSARVSVPSKAVDDQMRDVERNDGDSPVSQTRQPSMTTAEMHDAGGKCGNGDLSSYHDVSPNTNHHQQQQQRNPQQQISGKPSAAERLAAIRARVLAKSGGDINAANHAAPEVSTSSQPQPKPKRRLMIAKRHVIKHNPTDGCAGCKSLASGARLREHTAVCRARLEPLIRAESEAAPARVANDPANVPTASDVHTRGRERQPCDDGRSVTPSTQWRSDAQERAPPN